MFIEKHNVQLFLIITTITVLAVLGFSIALVIIYSKNLRQQEQASFKRILDELEKERRRIGRNLHDDVGPTLATAKLKMDAALLGIQNNPVISKLIKEQSQFLQDTINSVRENSHQLAPKNLLNEGLLAGVEERCQEINSLPNWEVSILAETFPESLSTESELNLYRIINELMTNSLKHSGGNMLTIEFSDTGDNFNIRYTDNGKGLGLENRQQALDGIGLSNIKTRAELMRGSMNFPKTKNGFEAILKFKISNLS